MLSVQARMRFGDIGPRAGTVISIDGWFVVKFDAYIWQVRLPPEDLERID